jgi:hypothetical protein
VSGVAIYVEGGGQSKDQKSALRTGFDQLIREQKEAVRKRGMKWSTVFCGSRNQARAAFLHALKVKGGSVLCVLLVDSEESLADELPVPRTETSEERVQRLAGDARARREHLIRRDGWTFEMSEPEQVHLMVQCMEAWIAADGVALASYYGNNFQANQLPNRRNLEHEPKDSILESLKRATKDTVKKEYGKIKHASALLALIDPRKVRERCPRFATFADWLSAEISKL